MNQKIRIAMEEFNKLESIEDSTIDIKLISECFAHVIQSIYDEKPELGEGEVFIETISIKILLATQSILQISNGIYISTINKKATVEWVDFSSINILTRSIIEAFLTIEYLYYNNLQDSERIFRLHIWRISGYKSRQSFFENRQNLKNDIKEKLDSEIVEINDLLQKIEASIHYKDLNKQNLWKLDTYGLPRLNSWSSLLENSVLSNQHFSVPYKLYSNYAHSEFISLIQLNGESNLCKGSNMNNISLTNALRVVKMINCVSIILLKSKFECTQKAYENIDEKLKEKIEFWHNIALKKDKH
ncbi:MAG: DUF5677 domain-containing protein [Bacteroidia bacterium]|nr:DUF5677 domain-containing protein [Bacteroidia bacterium]